MSECVQHSLGAVRIQLEDRATAEARPSVAAEVAPVNSGTVEVPSRIPDQTSYRPCTIRPASKGVQDRLFAGFIDFKDGSAIRSATTQLRITVEVAFLVPDQTSTHETAIQT